jgi:protein-S-isoprenylcysteine O-methyltransferase Ste14
MISMKKRVFIAVCGTFFFSLCGAVVFLIGLYFHLPGIVRLIGILIILGGLLGAITLVVTYFQTKPGTQRRDKN